MAEEYARDPEYRGALQKLSTYVFQKAILANNASTSAKNPTDMLLISDNDAKAAASIVAARTNLQSIITIGVTGNSLSTGKAASLGVVRFVAGMAISLAVGPIPIDGYTSVGVIYVPGGPADSWQMAGGLIDLRSGGLVKTRIVHGGGDPMKPEVLAQSNAIDLLLREMVFTNAKQ